MLPQQAMASTAFLPSMGHTHPSGAPFSYGMSHVEDGSQFAPDQTPQAVLADSDSAGAAILIRKLTRNMTDKELRSMFLFAKEFVESEFIAPELPEDQNHVSAVARFRSSGAALEAKVMLDGKPNTATEANMIVEILQLPGLGPNPHRRNTIDGAVNRGPPSSSSSSASNGGPNVRQASRFNSTFQNLETVSPPAATPVHGINTDFPFPEAGSHIQSLFTPQSPGGHPAGDPPRVTGKSVINDDSVDDDETGELLKDPVAYAKNGHAASAGSMSRRPTNPQIPVSRFAGLSLATTSIPSPSLPAFASSRSGAPGPAPVSAISPMMMNGMGPTSSSYQVVGPHYPRPNYPPVNPADQNPPCNTLYVGNLPIDTSEDELKAMFQKQRGYKRLCFRTKQNGPMCFVEFEDVSFATKALNELYGHPLHNSVKGGIRLSFSKNPLGVRTGQTGNGPGGLSASMSTHSSSAGMNGGGIGAISGPSFMTASGPPPGLTAPPGLHSSINMNAGSVGHLTSPLAGGFGSGPFASSYMGMGGLRGPPMAGGIAASAGGAGLDGMSGGYPDYMMGR